jgi:multiple sugar transport system permease protein
MAVALVLALPGLAQAGWVEDLPGKTVIHLKLYELPDAASPDPRAQADMAVIKELMRRFPDIFAERYRARYEANPAKYGNHRWDNVELRLHRFSGIQIQGMGMDSKPLMAIAGGVSPDILYVNFRQSDTYIQQGFLYPLDKPEDHYFTTLSEEEKEFRIHPKVMPVIDRKGPDGRRHIWAMPKGGISGRVMLYRKDLLDAHDIPYPKNDWTWDDYLAICKKVTDPAKGIYGAMYPPGSMESWHWTTFLWSAGGEVMDYNATQDEWHAIYNSPAGVKALDFYTRLCNEVWYDTNGRRRFGYVMREAPTVGGRWDMGQIAFVARSIDEKTFTSINPDVTGIVAVPKGPDGHRGSELNSQMQGIFAGVKDPVIRDMAWEYIRFGDCEDAVRIRTRVQIEGGLGRFINPRYLRKFGYENVAHLAPKEIEECFNLAIETGHPEPYGRNCQMVYEMLTKPLVEAAELTSTGAMPTNAAAREALLQKILDESVRETNSKMVGRVSARDQQIRRLSAGVFLLMVVVAFGFVFRNIARVFSPPPGAAGTGSTGWGFRRFFWAYLILVPALVSVFTWQYLPLVLGSKMAFQDYRIMGDSTWVWLDNFGAVLWDLEWWSAVWNSARYCALVVTLTFLPPVILAVLLQEIPVGKILFRTLFYLPAVITGLVVIYLWKSFYDPTEYGVLNAVVLSIPAAGYLGLGALFFLILFFFAKRLYVHERYKIAALCVVVGVIVAWFFFSFALPILNQPGIPWYRALWKTSPDPYRWLLDSKTAMLCCMLPMIWAGMGPGCLVYLAALKGIAGDFYEAADIDGATFIDKILFIVVPILKPLLVIQFVGIFIHSWNSGPTILAMTGGASNTTTAGLNIFYKAYVYLKFGPATAMAWILGFMLIGFTVHQLRILSRLEFKTTGDKK